MVGDARRLPQKARHSNVCSIWSPPAHVAAVRAGPDRVGRRAPADRDRLRRRRSRDHRRLAGRRRHHRDRRRAVPRPRAHRDVPIPGRPRAADPALHRAPDRHRRSARRRRAGAAAGPAELPGVRARRRHRGAQRHVRCRLPQREPAAPRLRRPSGARDLYREAGPAFGVARRSERQAPDARRVLPHAHEAHPPGAG